MNESKLLYKIIYDINFKINDDLTEDIQCSNYNISKPYSYIEAIGVGLINIHKDNEDYIEKMKRDENLFKNENDRFAFIHSGTYICTSTYNKFNYPHTTDSVSKHVSKIIQNAPS